MGVSFLRAFVTYCLVAEYQSRAGSTVETGNVWLTDPAREIIEPPVGDDRGQEAGRDGERR